MVPYFTTPGLRASALAIALVLVAAGTGAVAHDTDDGVAPDHQHGGTAGHLPATSWNVEVVASADLTNRAGAIADVAAYGNHAFLARFDPGDCQRGGVHVVDISNPANPVDVNFIRAGTNTYVGEGVQVLRLATAHFDGVVLVHNNEICDVTLKRTHGGISLVDVTDPVHHEWLAEGVGDFTNADGSTTAVAHSVHSAFAWQDGERAFAVLVDNEEARDVDVMEITDPRNPVMVGEWDLNRYGVLQADVHGQASFLHDVTVKEIGGRHVMLLSYWDGGYVRLDVSDPANPVFLGDTDFANPDPERAARGQTVTAEGNAHQAEFSHDDAFFIGTDEDFSPYRLVARNVDDDAPFDATEGSDTPTVRAVGGLDGVTVFGGRACDVDPAVPPAPESGAIAVVERGACAFTEKVGNVEAAGGYAGVIVFNREDANECTALVNMLVAGGIPALFVGRDTGYAFFDVPYDDAACRDGNGGLAPIPLGTVGDRVHVTSFFDGWGYVHLYDAAGNEVDTYAIPESQDAAFAEGFGDLSVHEVATDPDEHLAYFSWYSGGFRVLRFGADGFEPAGHWIPEGGTNLWGVEVHEHPNGEQYVLVSDRDHGLWILRYTGP